MQGQSRHFASMRSGPSCKAVNLLARIVKGLPAIVDADVANGGYVGRGIKLWDLALVVVAW